MHRGTRALAGVVAVASVLIVAAPVVAAEEAWVLVAAPVVDELASGSTTVPYTSFGGPLGTFTQDVSSRFASGRLPASWSAPSTPSTPS